MVEILHLLRDALTNAGVFDNPTATRYNWMNFVYVVLAANALGVTVKTAA